MKKFDCKIVDNELWVARDSGHHYLTKFTLSNGKWIIGNKRGKIDFIKCGKGIFYPRIIMTMGYYENPEKDFGLRIRESNYELIMSFAIGQ